MASDVAWVKWAKKKGFNVLAAGTDSSLFSAALESIVESIKQDRDHS